MSFRKLFGHLSNRVDSFETVLATFGSFRILFPILVAVDRTPFKAYTRASVKRIYARGRKEYMSPQRPAPQTVHDSALYDGPF